MPWPMCNTWGFAGAHRSNIAAAYIASTRRGLASKVKPMLSSGSVSAIVEAGAFSFSLVIKLGAFPWLVKQT